LAAPVESLRLFDHQSTSGDSTSLRPQWSQKFGSSGKSAPQRGQVRARSTPQCLQKLAETRFTVWQFGQIIGNPETSQATVMPKVAWFFGSIIAAKIKAGLSFASIHCTGYRRFDIALWAT
jgi:hypothetical protein